MTDAHDRWTATPRSTRCGSGCARSATSTPGVDRFVLAPAHSARGSAAIAVLASLRVGVLGGLLLGPAAAIGLALQLPALVTSVRDAGVIAIYMAVLFGAGIAAGGADRQARSSTLVARRTGRFAGQARTAHRDVAGAAVALAALVYLTLLWTRRPRRRLRAEHPVLWTATGSGRCGRDQPAARPCGHADRARAHRGRHRHAAADAGRSGRSWRALLGVGVAAFAGARRPLQRRRRRRARGAASAPPPLTVVSSGARLRLIAIDGFDPAVFDTLSAAGRLPALTPALAGARRLSLPTTSAQALAAGSGARVDDHRDRRSRPDVHGVHSLETRRVAGLTGILHAGDDSTAGRLLGAVDRSAAADAAVDGERHASGRRRRSGRSPPTPDCARWS